MKTVPAGLRYAELRKPEPAAPAPEPLVCALDGAEAVHGGDSWTRHTYTCPVCGFTAGAYLDAWARRLWLEEQAGRRGR